MDLETGTEKLLARIEDGVGWLTYNSPARLNALSMSMQQAVPSVLDRFQADDDVRVIVTTGAGGKAFVSGADISEFGEKRTSPEARGEYDEASAEVGRAYARVEKPILAMIQGYCIGGGLITAMAADIRICGEGSQFGVPCGPPGPGLRLRRGAAAHPARRPGVGVGDPLLRPAAVGGRGPCHRPGQPGGARRRARVGGQGAGRDDRRQRPPDRAGGQGRHPRGPTRRGPAATWPR